MALFLFVAQLPCMSHNTLVRHAYFSRPSSGEVKCFSDGVVFACHAKPLDVTQHSCTLRKFFSSQGWRGILRYGLQGKSGTNWLLIGRLFFLKFNFIAFETKYKDSSTICTW